MNYHFTLYIDEAGDDKLARLKPEHENGNSEWLCLGGYLIRSEYEADMVRRRDEIRRAIGGKNGDVLHYRDLKPKNRHIACQLLASDTNPAMGYVVCSYKKTFHDYRHPRVEAVYGAQHKDTLYNYLARILLERATQAVAHHGRISGINDPKLRVLFASRRGHHFGAFKAYLFGKLVPQAIAGTTYQDQRGIEPNVLVRDLVDRAPASTDAGLQLADVLVSAFYQSLEQASPHHGEKTAKHLMRLMAKSRSKRSSRAHEGVTLFLPSALSLLTEAQKELFTGYGYRLRSGPPRSAKKEHFTQEQRLWSCEFRED